MAVITRNLVKPNAYFDSVALMRIAASLDARPEVVAASLMMGTPANRELLEEAGLLAPNGRSAGSNDLVLAVRADEEIVDALLGVAEAGLDSGGPVADGRIGQVRPRMLDQVEGANLAMISTPGPYAAAEALKALKLGLHVFLFSDNVPPEEELLLKQEAARRGLLVMGPDCGTAIINGVPLGFANAVRRGDIGLVGASGTGSQEVSCLVDRAGAGISQLIGVGGNDLSEAIGAGSMLFALDALAADPATRVIVLVSKPPAPSVAGQVLERAARAGKPVVVNFLGVSVEASGNLHPAATLEEAALLAASLSLGHAVARADHPALPSGLAARLGTGRSAIRALYSGGTFAYQAELLLGEVATSAGHWIPGRPVVLPPGHLVLDLGDDQYTVGRPHPMIDPSLRVEFLRAAAAAPDTAVILLDVVLGTGSAADPAGALLSAIPAAEGGPLVIAHVCGTVADAQGLDRQEALLRGAGVILAPSSTAAVRLAGEVLAARGAPA
ncbi:MAG: acyl-CoA synthetase FdrA [Candidatus Dormibacteraeota bacterium]|nr:acyl-CoA synthetase FdrA [Candidatus Dormibacteraeota bacterium]